MGHKSPSSRRWSDTADILATRRASDKLSRGIARRYETLANASGQRSVPLGSYDSRNNLNLAAPIMRSRNCTLGATPDHQPIISVYIPQQVYRTPGVRTSLVHVEPAITLTCGHNPIPYGRAGNRACLVCGGRL